MSAEEVRPAMAVEIVPDGSEATEIGGDVVEAQVPPIATAVAIGGRQGEANVQVHRAFRLPAGGAVEVEGSYAVDIEVIEPGVQQ